MPYFVSGLALATLEGLFATGRLPRDWRRFKFQMLMVFRVQNEPRDVPALNKRKDIDGYCKSLLELLDKPADAEAVFKRAGDLITTVKAKTAASRDLLERTRSFTMALIDSATAGKGAHAAVAAREQGTVEFYDDLRGFGRINGDDGSNYFVHIRDVRGIGVTMLIKGQIVVFNVVEAKPSNRAVDVEIVE